MTKDELFAFYEKLYFHEIDMREKLNGRTQIFLAIIAAQFSLVTFLVNNTKNIEVRGAGDAYLVLLFATILYLCAALFYFVRSWYNYEYAFLPAANATEEYRNLLIETYKKYDNAVSLVENVLKDYVSKYYAECSTQNTLNNDQRTRHFHNTATSLIFSFCFSIITIALFYLANLNVENEAIHKVQITKPILLENGVNARQQPAHQVPKEKARKGGN